MANCAINESFCYNKSLPSFHQWRDIIDERVYGVKFNNIEEGTLFAETIEKIVDSAEKMSKFTIETISNDNNNNNEQNGNAMASLMSTQSSGNHNGYIHHSLSMNESNVSANKLNGMIQNETTKSSTSTTDYHCLNNDKLLMSNNNNNNDNNHQQHVGNDNCINDATDCSLYNGHHNNNNNELGNMVPGSCK